MPKWDGMLVRQWIITGVFVALFLPQDEKSSVTRLNLFQPKYNFRKKIFRIDSYEQ